MLFFQNTIFTKMINTKLLALYQKLSASELKQLKRYIHASFFNENETVKQLFTFIYPSLLPLQAEELGKEKAYHFLFPNKRYNDSKMRKIMFALLKATEDFLVFQAWKKKETTQAVMLADIYAQKQLPKHFQGAVRRAQSLQQKALHQDGHFFYRQYQLEQVKSQFLEQQQDRKTEPNLQNVSDALDSFYLINKLHHCCSILNYGNIFKTTYAVKLLDELLAYCAKSADQELPAVQLYYQTLLTLRESEQETHFFKLKDLLAQHYKALPTAEMRYLHTLARNYCIKQLNSGNVKFIKELFALYKMTLAKDLLVADGELSPWTYKNVVAVGLNLREFDWTADFIHQYQNTLPAKHRSGIFTFNLAKLHFAKGEYDEVIPLLHQVEMDDLFLYMDAKIMLVKTYYELDESKALFSLLDSLKIWLLRKKVVGYHKENYKNIIRFTKRLLMVNPFNKQAIKALEAQIESTKILTEKRWLLEKAKDLV